MNFVLASLSITALSAELLATIENGQIRGKVLTNSVNGFLQIPYAKAPIGDLRFCDPEPFTDAYDNGTYDASMPGPVCPQDPGLVLPNQPQSEDCLYLKVLVPATAPSDDGYPVLIFIHGGQYMFGTGLDLFTSATTMVETSINDNNAIIVVTFNYRIGVLGWLYDEKYGTGINGNFGIKDQALAIKWVHQNIAAFGGDPNKLTLYGESAGASSVGIHLTNKDLKGISHSIVGAIMSSPYVGQSLNTIDIFEAGQFGQTFIDDTGCQSSADILNCLKNENQVTTQQILALQSKFPFVFPNFLWAPIVDKNYIKFEIWKAFERGYGIWSETDMNILIGYNKDEGTLFSDYYLNLEPDIVLNTVDELKNFFIDRDTLQINNVDISEASNIYDSMFTALGLDTVGITTSAAFDAYVDKYIFKCPINNIANSMAANPYNHNIYKYFFTQIDHTINALTFGNINAECVTTTCHAQEIYYIFRSPQVEAFFGLFIPGYTYSQTVIDTSIILQKIMAQFTTHGTTGIDETNIWPQYKLDNRVSKELSLATLNDPATDINPDQCSTLDDIGYAADYNNVNPKQCKRKQEGCSVTNDCCGHLVCNQWENRCKPCIHQKNKNKKNAKCVVNSDCCHGLICNVEEGECTAVCKSGYAADSPFQNIAPEIAENTVYVLHISWSHIIVAVLVLFVCVAINLYHCKQNENKYIKVDMTSTDDDEQI